jgi:hypothetical protein
MEESEENTPDLFSSHEWYSLTAFLKKAQQK